MQLQPVALHETAVAHSGRLKRWDPTSTSFWVYRVLGLFRVSIP